MKSALLLHGSDNELNNINEARKIRGENIQGAIGTVMTNVLSSNIKSIDDVPVDEAPTGSGYGATGSPPPAAPAAPPASATGTAAATGSSSSSSKRLR